MLTSHAQNFEDVILWRALGHVGKGFYIDIGAQDPVVDSVSLAFHEAGWRGVHVEPSPDHAARLRAARPDEEVIEAAVTAEKTLILHDVPGTGLSTGVAGIAAAHRQAGHAPVERTVGTIALGALLDRYAGRDVHWLKIDVEGMEDAVLASWGDSAVRPWVVAVESTVPNSSEPAFEGWEPELVARDYRFVYFDGINRFYLHAAHADLAAAFGPGPNYFDGFTLAEHTTSPFVAGLAGELARLRADLAARQKDLEARQESLEANVARARELAGMAETWKTAAGDLQTRCEALQTALADLQAALAERQAALAAALARAGELADLAAERERQSRAAEAEIARLRASTSWKITAPLRAAGRLAGRLAGRRPG